MSKAVRIEKVVSSMKYLRGEKDAGVDDDG